MAQPGLTLAEATEAFQAYLEGVRAFPEDEALAEDLERARAVMETAWLEQRVQS